MIFTFKGTEAECSKFHTLAEELGLESQTQLSQGNRSNSRSDVMEQILTLFKPNGFTKMTATQLKKELEDFFECEYDNKTLGASLREAGFIKKSIRIDGKPVGGYEVATLEDERRRKFAIRQAEDFKYLGVYAKDFNSPDEFNEACRKAEKK